jgi:transcriptional regulator with XRE-family HTH domain
MTSSDARRVFGRNVRRARRARGYSQEELAERAGMHRTYVGSLERGERNVSLKNIVALAAALDVEPGALFEGLGTSWKSEAS